MKQPHLQSRVCQVLLVAISLITAAECSREPLQMITCAARHCSRILDPADHILCIRRYCSSDDLPSSPSRRITSDKRWIDNTHYTDAKRWIDTSHYTDLKRRSADQQNHHHHDQQDGLREEVLLHQREPQQQQQQQQPQQLQLPRQPEADVEQDELIQSDETRQRISYCYQMRCHSTNTFKALVNCIQICVESLEGQPLPLIEPAEDAEMSEMRKKWVDPLNYGFERKRSGVYKQFMQCFHKHCSKLNSEDLKPCVKQLCLPQLVTDDDVNEIESLDRILGD